VSRRDYGIAAAQLITVREASQRYLRTIRPVSDRVGFRTVATLRLNSTCSAHRPTRIRERLESSPIECMTKCCSGRRSYDARRAGDDDIFARANDMHADG
jgi:hypothetical protein